MTLSPEQIKHLKLMTSTPGWRLVVSHIKEQVERNSYINSVNMDTDANIVLSVKKMQSRRDVYNSLLRWVEDAVEDAVKDPKTKNGGT